MTGPEARTLDASTPPVVERESHTAVASIPLEDYVRLFADCGGTDENYLRHHFARFAWTHRQVRHGLASDGVVRPVHVLDIGAHWLHQSLLFALDDCEVTALDLPVTFGDRRVRELARRHGIRLVACGDLEHATELEALDADTFDVVLFTEIIEHVTFNPVAMWRAIHRVLRPGGRIVVTTPNHYALRSRAWQWGRFVRGGGAGIRVPDILSKHTRAHHWKEYSLRELVDYFTMLSPDFRCGPGLLTEDHRAQPASSFRGRLARRIERALPILRPGLYLEVRVPRKDQGIVVEPTW